MASLFNKIFGGGSKVDFSQMMPEPPKFSLAEGSQRGYTTGLQDLINVFQKRSTGQDQFDYMNYVYGPQETKLRQLYGIDTQPGDIYSTKSGSLPQTMASMNQRGILDTGTSALVEGQQRTDLSNKLAELFGQAKVSQKGDVDASLEALHSLYPEMFSAQNISSEVDYNNAMNSYNALLNRNAATMQQTADINANRSKNLISGIGLLAGGIGGGMAGAGMFGASGALAGGGASGFMTGAMGNMTGGYNPVTDQLKSLFKQKGVGVGRGGDGSTGTFARELGFGSSL